MKALILAGGRGKRLNEITRSQNKCMVEVNGRNAITYSLEYALRDDIDDIVIVVGYRAEEIINRFGTDFRGKKISYVIQWEQKGLVHAMECAREALGGDDFLLLLGDEVFLEPRHDDLLGVFRQLGTYAACGMIPVEDTSLISKTYAALFDADGVVHRLIEKPAHPMNEMMGTGSCVLSNGIFDYIDVTPLHHLRKEKELPDLIQCAIDDGKTVRMVELGQDYVNINMREDLHMASKIFD